MQSTKKLSLCELYVFERYDARHRGETFAVVPDPIIRSVLGVGAPRVDVAIASLISR